MLNIVVPSIVFYLMLLLGMSLTIVDLRRINRHRRQVLILTLAQLLLLPLLAYALGRVMQVSAFLSMGLLLVSICPGGALSNFYTLIAKADVPLSLTLTTLSSLLSILCLPIFMFVILPAVTDFELSHVVVLEQLKQLVQMLLLPISLGLFLRQRFESYVLRVLLPLERLGLMLLIILLSTIVYRSFHRLYDQWILLVMLAASFSVLSALLAVVLSYVMRLNARSMVAVLFEFPLRNMAVAVFLAITLLNDRDYLIFSAVFMIVQTPFMLMLAFASRTRFHPGRFSVSEGSSENSR